MMKKLILIFLVIPFFSLSQEEITLKTKTGDIKGSLLVPSNSEKFQ